MHRTTRLLLLFSLLFVACDGNSPTGIVGSSGVPVFEAYTARASVETEATAPGLVLRHVGSRDWTAPPDDVSAVAVDIASRVELPGSDIASGATVVGQLRNDLVGQRIGLRAQVEFELTGTGEGTTEALANAEFYTTTRFEIIGGDADYELVLQAVLDGDRTDWFRAVQLAGPDGPVISRADSGTDVTPYVFSGSLPVGTYTLSMIVRSAGSFRDQFAGVSFGRVDWSFVIE